MWLDWPAWLFFSLIGGYVKQYYHQQFLFPRSTVMVEIPSQQQLIHMINTQNSKLILLRTGFSLVHPDDRFIKVEGRKIADSKVKPQTFRLKRVEYEELGNMVFTVETISLGEERIKELTFKVFNSKNRVYFIRGLVR